ncbi:short-chain dehydrogenase [Pandoraea terrae]|uniref:Short-chain dehydrogenase n=1 Tax=Pandoraea terrae TaxID=1537710 RepID=A0A5E4UDS6_9BURK|nr:SDR family oxidoreductase [Pandoraea terrae]VVD97632.1 short-chain dehydrogenase [Pandoraea terrae]
MGRLQGKIALITGAGQGVGQGIAFALAKEGAAIAVAGRTEDKLIATCEQIKGFGAHAVPIRCDVTSADDITHAVAHTVETFGGVDILVNNANDGGPMRLLDATDEYFQKGFDTGPMATLRLMRACYPHMAARGGGAIVNLVSSAAVRWDAANYGIYAAVKEAMRSLTRAAASEWGRDNIRVNAVAPHALSPGLKWWTEKHPEEAAEFVKTIPLGRVGECEEDIGRAVAFLVSADAGYLTGATIPLDGGQARWC